MTARIIDGKAIAAAYRARIKAVIAAQKQAGRVPPGLAVILVGEDPASNIYVQNKREACKEVGIASFYHPLPHTVPESELIALIQQLNQDNSVHGILLQLPLPKHINTDKVLEHIDPKKDVDGFHPYNLGRLAQRHPLLRPCTPFGVMMLLEHMQLPLPGKHAVIVGASNIVGKPMALELLAAGCTITLCHSLTADLATHIQQADILVSAVGTPGLIKGAWIKPGATVIDIGITRLADGSITGDVEFAKAQEKAAWITPVPGGVGPMTVTALMQNTLIAAGLEKLSK